MSAIKLSNILLAAFVYLCFHQTFNKRNLTTRNYVEKTSIVYTDQTNKKVKLSQVKKIVISI